MHRKNLGKGLSELLQTDTFSSAEEIQEIPIENIKPNPLQPRKYFDEEQLKELSASIKDNGLIQPIIVTQDKNQFEIVVGERRWRACKMLALKKIPAIVKNWSNYKLLEVALIENIQREDLNIIEEAISYQELLKQTNLKQEELASRIGKTRTLITNTIRLLKLPQHIQHLIIQKKITKGHARTLLALDRMDLYIETVKDLIIDWNLSVRQTEKLVHLINNSGMNKLDAAHITSLLHDLFPLQDKSKTSNRKPHVQPASTDKQSKMMIATFQQNLNQYLNTKVQIKPKQGKDQGTIQIQYQNQEDLSRIIELIHLNTKTDSAGSI